MNPERNDPDFTRIVGLSDRVSMPRCGRIRLGGPKPAKGPGRELSYFRFDEDALEQYPLIGERYADRETGAIEPKELDVVLMSEEISVVCPQARRFYGRNRGLRCIGNGEQCRRFVCREHKAFDCDCENPQYDEEIGVCSKECPKYQQGKCADIATLKVVLPDLTFEGLWWLETKSYHNIVRLNSGLKMIRMALGRISNVPLKLRRVPVKMTYEGTARTHYLLSIGFAGGLDEARRIRGELAAVTVRALLPPPDPEPHADDPDEQPETDVVYDEGEEPHLPGVNAGPLEQFAFTGDEDTEEIAKPDGPSEAQVEKITELGKACGFDRTWWAKFLKPFKVERIGALTAEQADALIAKLTEEKENMPL